MAKIRIRLENGQEMKVADVAHAEQEAFKRGMGWWNLTDKKTMREISAAQEQTDAVHVSRGLFNGPFGSVALVGLLLGGVDLVLMGIGANAGASLLALTRSVC